MKMILSIIVILCIGYALFNWSAENPASAHRVNTSIKQGANDIIDKSERAVDELIK